jgi:spore coat polysaccharide biosynthesis protein SpsF (cytidylyltransferase family)
VTIPIIIQARLNSTRLPKKVLTRINGIPLLEYLLNRLTKNFDKSQIFIATSNQHEDNPIHQYCINNDFFVFRGLLMNVAKRMLDAAKKINARSFVRINGDSPLIDPLIIQQAIKIYKKGNYDLVTNTFPRSYPIGQSVEVIRTSTFEYVYEKMSSSGHFEHVTKFYYDYPDEYQIRNFLNKGDLSSYRLVVDTPKDLERLKKIIGTMVRPYTDYSLDELIDLYPIS